MEMSVQVSNAVTNVQSGTTALQSAKKHQKSSRKWMCIAIIILLIIVAVIVVGVIKPWKSGNSWVFPLVKMSMTVSFKYIFTSLVWVPSFYSLIFLFWGEIWFVDGCVIKDFETRMLSCPLMKISS